MPRTVRKVGALPKLADFEGEISPAYQALLRGDPRQLYHPGQLAMFNAFLKSKEVIFVTTAGRGVGKTGCFWWASEAMAYGSRGSFSANVKYIGPDIKLLRNILREFVALDMQNLPKDMWPRFSRDFGGYIYPGGATIGLIGVDQDIAGLGQNIDFVVCEEAGFYDEPNQGAKLTLIVEKMALPRLRKGGRIAMPTTPGRSMQHIVNAHYVPQAIANNSYFRIDSFQNPYRDKETIDRAIAETLKKHGGDIVVRREYYGEVVADPTIVAVPEFDPERDVKACTRPTYWDSVNKYVWIDYGFAPDFTAILLAWADFANGRVVVEHCTILSKKGTSETAEIVKSLLREYNYTPNAHLTLWADAPDPRYIYDLAMDHGLMFSPFPKERMRASINRLRNAMLAESVVINPQCQDLVAQLKNCVWRGTGVGLDTFARSSVFGHYDAVAALAMGLGVVSFIDDPATGERLSFTDWQQKFKPQSAPYVIQPPRAEALKNLYNGPRGFLRGHKFSRR